MPDIYSVTMLTNGIKYSVFFFASFSGHFHPFTPIHPLEIDAVHDGLDKHDRVPYYQGWYSDAEKRPRLDRLLKYRLYKAPINIDIKLSNIPGVYYHHIEKIGGVWKIKELLTPEALLKQENYFRYLVNKEGKVEFAYRIYATLMDSYVYTYKKNNALDKVDTTVMDIPEKIPD